MEIYESLVIVRNGDRILLGLKLRGFGKNKWNGFGGKLKNVDGRSLEACARREALEEAGIKLGRLTLAGKTRYIFEGVDEPDHLVSVFTTDYFEGEPCNNCGEMDPEWFEVNEVPFDAIDSDSSRGCGMWDNDRYWMKHLLEREYFEAKIRLDFEKTFSCVVNGREYCER